IVVSTVLVLFVALAFSHPSDTSTVDAERTAQESYEHALVPLVTQGGRTVELGVKVGIGDLEKGDLAPEVVAQQAYAWGTDLHSLSVRVEALQPPARLHDAQAGFVMALRAYEHTSFLV